MAIHFLVARFKWEYIIIWEPTKVWLKYKGVQEFDLLCSNLWHLEGTKQNIRLISFCPLSLASTLGLPNIPLGLDQVLLCNCFLLILVRSSLSDSDAACARHMPMNLYINQSKRQFIFIIQKVEQQDGAAFGANCTASMPCTVRFCYCYRITALRSCSLRIRFWDQTLRRSLLGLCSCPTKFIPELYQTRLSQVSLSVIV